MNFLFAILAFIVGFIVTAVVGLISTWIDRKVTARIHARVGPPLLQPFYDVVKLLGKETLIPKGAKRAGFLLAPLLGLAGVTLASIILWSGILWHGPEPPFSFVGDLIVVIYLLILPSLAIILGGSASGNPLGAVGASREMKLVMAYELPFLLAIFTAVYKLSGTLKIDGLVTQTAHPIGSISGVIAFIVTLLCIQAKLAYVPFDIPEAEQEIIAGPFTEYSGAPLAAFKLTRAMLLFTLPVFLITVFMGAYASSGWLGILWGILTYVGILVFIILVKNTNPRLRIDQAVKFFWLPWTILAVIGLVLAIVGSAVGINWL